MEVLPARLAGEVNLEGLSLACSSLLVSAGITSGECETTIIEVLIGYLSVY